MDERVVRINTPDPSGKLGEPYYMIMIEAECPDMDERPDPGQGLREAWHSLLLDVAYGLRLDRVVAWLDRRIRDVQYYRWEDF